VFCSRNKTLDGLLPLTKVDSLQNAEVTEVVDDVVVKRFAGAHIDLAHSTRL